MRYTILALLLAACAVDSPAPATVEGPLDGPALTLTRVHELTYELEAEAPIGRVRWTLDHRQNLSPASPLWLSIDALRVRALDWHDGAGWRQVLLCSNCDVIESVRLVGGSVLGWTGPGRGGGVGPHDVVWLLDGMAIKLGVGEVAVGDVLELRQTATGYAPDGPVSMGSPRAPVLARRSMIRIDPTGMDYDLEVTTLADHEMYLTYAGRLEAQTPCRGGLVTGYRASDGSTWPFGPCGPTERNGQVNLPAQPWVELTSDTVPWSVRVTSIAPAAVPWYLIDDTAAAHSDKAKIYGVIPGVVARTRGEVTRHAHRVDLLN